MRGHLSLRTPFFLSSPASSSSSSSSRRFLLLIGVSHISKPSNYSSASQYYSRRHDEESRNVRVSVWWDFENCNVPTGINVFKIAHSITAAIRANGIKGPIEITAFGDMLQLSRPKQEALSSTGINLTHIPSGGKNSADRSLLLNLMYWISQNPPPAHLFLISGDRDFASILHRLRMNNYNILLASPENAPGVLCSAASIMWHWHDLLRGENLAGKYFNQPPDGPSGSWYGHYKVPLLDPFSDIEQQACLQIEESPEPSADEKPRSVPKAVAKQIRKIVNSHPKGLSITELRKELGKLNLTLDKDYYGYKRFVPFLLSQKHILQLKQEGGGHFIIHRVTQNSPETFEENSAVSTGPAGNNEDEALNAPSKLSCDDKSVKECADRKSLSKSSEKLTISPSSELNAKYTLGRAHKPSLDGNMSEMVIAPQSDSYLPPGGEKIVETVNAPEAGGHLTPGDEKVNPSESESSLPPVLEHDSSSEVGFFKKVWRKWFGSKSGDLDSKNCKDQEKYCTSADGSEKKSRTTSEKQFTSKISPATEKDEEKHLKATVSTSHSLSLDEPVLDTRISTSFESNANKPTRSPGFLGRIQNWCKSWKDTSDSDYPSERASNRPNLIASQSGEHELFLQDSFWSTMESFMNSPKGSLLVSESRTREQMAHNLQRKGPFCLQSLGENDLLHLIDLLISEKKWVEECPSEVFPFKLTCVGISENISHVEPSPLVNEKLPVRSRAEVLADCQKLVTEILKEHPRGFFVGLFRKHFLERYGYHIDLQKLGFKKLTSLLETMSGLKIDSGYIIPSDNIPKIMSLGNSVLEKQEITSHAVVSDSESPDASKKGDGNDSLWDELGPVDSTKSNKNELGSVLKSSVESVEKHMDFDYEPALSDDDSSDSGETSLVFRAEGQRKAREVKEGSSLLRILDSWYSSNGGDSCKDKSGNVDAADLSTDTANSLSSSMAGGQSEISWKNQGRKQKPQKSYSFVADPVSNNSKEKLVDGILGNLRKANESSKNAGVKVLCE